MGYDVSLYKVPTELKGQNNNGDSLFDIVYDGGYRHCLLAYTGFSMDNPESVNFAEVFDIELTNDDYFRIYNVNDYKEAKKRLQTMSLDEGLLERINKFLKHIEYELNKGEVIFFCCG